MKKLWEEFKKFISKGNIVDLAIAVIIGAAFNKIVSSLVNDVIMPLISCAVGGADVSDWKWVIKPAEYDATGNVIVAETALRYGSFIQTIIDFLIIAITLFVIFKVITFSKNKIDSLGNTIIKETKEYQAKHKKIKKNKKGQVEEVETQTVAEETPVEVKPEETPAPAKTPAEPEKTESTKEDLMIHLLQEIRDSLKTK